MNTGVHIPRLSTYLKHTRPVPPGRPRTAIETATDDLSHEQALKLVRWMVNHGRVCTPETISAWRVTQRLRKVT